MKEIPLTKGYVALVDDEDFERVSKFKWYALVLPRKVYAAHKNNTDSFYLHRFILGVTDPKTQIDHEDHNGLNCQKHNLRIATKSQNGGNMRKHSDYTTSRFKGVYWDSQSKKWQSQIIVQRKRIRLGGHHSEEAAARSYDAAARLHFGEFAQTNF
jgi:hypothetical protein